MKTTALSLALVLAAAVATPALAGEARVSWKDLDLSSETGKAELDRRIAAAAQKVCTLDIVTGQLVRRSPSKSCLAEASDRISSQIAARTAPDRLASAAPGGASAAGEAR